MTTATEPRYLVKINGNQLGRPELHALVADFPPTTCVTITSVMSRLEFANIMGDAIPIAAYMIRQVAGPKEWSITIGADDVLAVESDNNIQANVVRALLPEADRHASIEDLGYRYRDYSEISLAATDFLLSLHDEFTYPEEEPLSTLADMAGKNGITLDDMVMRRTRDEVTDDGSN